MVLTAIHHPQSGPSRSGESGACECVRRGGCFTVGGWTRGALLEGGISAYRLGFHLEVIILALTKDEGRFFPVQKSKKISV